MGFLSKAKDAITGAGKVTKSTGKGIKSTTKSGFGDFKEGVGDVGKFTKEGGFGKAAGANIGAFGEGALGGVGKGVGSAFGSVKEALPFPDFKGLGMPLLIGGAAILLLVLVKK